MSGIVLILWRVHVGKRKGQGDDTYNATPVSSAESRDFEEYGHLRFHEKSLKDLEAGMERPERAMLGWK